MATDDKSRNNSAGCWRCCKNHRGMSGNQVHTDASCMDYLYRTGCIHNNLFKQMSADFIRAVAFAIRLVAVAVLIWAVRWW
ncbi:hypothetical protein GO193_21025 [Escherichia coli]|nr:hypothetical protein [Escherichia coli]